LFVRLGKIFGSSAFAGDRIYGRSWAVPGPKNRARHRDRLRDAFGAAGVGLLLFSVVVAGAQKVFFFTLLAAWILLPVLVGFRNTLDAGCIFMLISLGVVVVVGIAQNGVGYLLP
jgi:lysylphosphatidylglycerol synthetase-like protein (DUF2156 family)